ncbi:LacI family DNA-binding transcriptional regulator [Paenibacillus sp. D2_2]|uniref:LacI family DNA-binding transcriptional regulator n=1 Tax=Paenibacillus sp. D2_2 TaxID=3073092 RepID=UPI002815C53F|nr:LacI family DNA-binding transcriptional regulator [Paenibacillus sp. D2_2]WMT41449.1 LacI family DNA-binding transcriptional regulator [Paenibacillus sp. D2_2]
MTTLKDIAERVGVSISTVSRVINQNDSRRISEETKQKIWKAANEMNYSSTGRVRSAKMKEAQDPSIAKPAIGCILALQDNKYNHPYFSPMIQGIETKLLERGISLAFLHTQAELHDEVVLNSLLEMPNLKGIICIEGLSKNLFKRLKERVPLIVGIDVNDPDIPVVTYDRVAAARTAVGHLIQRGHTRIGFIGGIGLSGSLDREKRYSGYRKALEEHGLEYRDQWVINANWDADESYHRMKELLELPERPTAMFSASDMLAIGAMRATTEVGLNIPADMSFVGVDDIEFSKYTSPPLTTVHVPKYEMGYAAAKLLMDSMEDAYPFPFRMQVPFELKLRHSVFRME